MIEPGGGRPSIDPCDRTQPERATQALHAHQTHAHAPERKEATRRIVFWLAAAAWDSACGRDGGMGISCVKSGADLIGRRPPPKPSRGKPAARPHPGDQALAECLHAPGQVAPPSAWGVGRAAQRAVRPLCMRPFREGRGWSDAFNSSLAIRSRRDRTTETHAWAAGTI